jgi:hypothetical protein
VTAGGPEIWLGDLIRARALLGGGHEVDYALAQLLLGGGIGAQRGETRDALAHLAFGEEIEGRDAAQHDEADEDEATGIEDEFAEIVATFPELQPLRTDTVPATDWELFASLPAATAVQFELRPPHVPLLPHGTTPAILQALLRTKARDGEPDVARMVERFAQGMPLMRIVRRPRSTMRFGTQVLMDVGEAMEPFARDQGQLADRIRDLMGAEGVELLSFADAPRRGVRRGRSRTREPYRPPPPGARVLVVSDLGVGGRALNQLRADPGEWLDFVDEIERAGCSAVALVPFPPERIPVSLAARLPLVTWDRGTDTSRASMAVSR